MQNDTNAIEIGDVVRQNRDPNEVGIVVGFHSGCGYMVKTEGYAYPLFWGSKTCHKDGFSDLLKLINESES